MNHGGHKREKTDAERRASCYFSPINTFRSVVGTNLMRLMKITNLLATPAMLFLFAGCETGYFGPPPTAGAPTAPPPEARPAPAPPSSAPRHEPWVDVSITVPERQVIQGYVATYVIEEKHPKKGKKPKKLPHGLQKKLDRGEPLPPGWEKKLKKGEIVPVEIYQHCEPLPREVTVQLPPQPPGTILITIGGKVARLLAATREILDVFEVEY